MSLETRLRSLEAHPSDDGRCPHGAHVVWAVEDDRAPSGPRVCPECGRVRPVIRVTYDD